MLKDSSSNYKNVAWRSNTCICIFLTYILYWGLQYVNEPPLWCEDCREWKFRGLSMCLFKRCWISVNCREIYIFCLTLISLGLRLECQRTPAYNSHGLSVFANNTQYQYQKMPQVLWELNSGISVECCYQQSCQQVNNKKRVADAAKLHFNFGTEWGKHQIN